MSLELTLFSIAVVLGIGIWLRARRVSGSAVQPGLLLPKDMFGVVEALRGKPRKSHEHLARTHWKGSRFPETFEDPAWFLEGGGEIGHQTKLVVPDSNRSSYHGDSDAFVFCSTEENPVAPVHVSSRFFKVSFHPILKIPPGQMGLVTTYAGEPLHRGEIAGPVIRGHHHFADALSFLEKGGCKGLQREVLKPGSHCVHPYFATVEVVPQQRVPEGCVGVVVDLPFNGTSVLCPAILDLLEPGSHPRNPHCEKLLCVPVGEIALNWSPVLRESHGHDQDLDAITVPFIEGHAIKLDVTLKIHIARDYALQLVAGFGSFANMVKEVLQPALERYFRSEIRRPEEVEGFLSDLEARQRAAKECVARKLASASCGIGLVDLQINSHVLTGQEAAVEA